MILDSADIEHFCHRRKFYWTALSQMSRLKVHILSFWEAPRDMGSRKCRERKLSDITCTVTYPGLELRWVPQLAVALVVMYSLHALARLGCSNLLSVTSKYYILDLLLQLKPSPLP